MRTGRTDKLGDWFNSTLRIECVGSTTYDPVTGRTTWTAGAAAGKHVATFAGVAFTVLPVRTYVEYPTGVFEVETTGGVVTGGNAIVKQSYDETWATGWVYNSGGPLPDPEPTIHAQEYRFMCQLWDVTIGAVNTKCYWLSEGTGYTEIDNRYPVSYPPRSRSYVPKVSCTLEATLDFSRLINCQEQVWIKQATRSSGRENWSWQSDDDPHQWMSKLTGEYKIVSAEDAGTFYDGGCVVNGQPHRRPGVSVYTWGNKTISSLVGMTSTIPTFGYFLGSPSVTITDHVSDSELSFGKGSIGLSDMDLRLGYDTATPPVPIEYTGDSDLGGGDTCSARGEDNEIEYFSTKGGSGYVKAEWTNLGLSYKWDGDMRHVDGTALEIDPEFTDSSGNSFTGSTAGVASPIYVYSGVWSLNMYELDGVTHLDNHDPETDWDTNHWARSDAAPTEFSLRLTNPSDYCDNEFEEMDPDTEDDEEPVMVTRKDSRILLQYPREHYVVKWESSRKPVQTRPLPGNYDQDDDFVMDELTTLGSSGVGGWSASGCTLERDINGRLVATDVVDGAYIYRADFLVEGNPYRPKHWPMYRWCYVNAKVTDAGTETAAAFDGSLAISRTQGITDPDGTFDKTFTHFFNVQTLDNISHARFDTCKTAEATATDATQSCIDQMQPEQTEEDLPFMELSGTSWSWGILGFDRIEIHLEAGLDYTFYGLTCAHQNVLTPLTYPKAGVEVEREWNKWYYPGDIMAAEETDEHEAYYIEQKVTRQAIVNANAKWCADIPSTRRQVLPVSGLIVFKNYSVYDAFIAQVEAGVLDRNSWGMFPPDTFTSWDFTPYTLYNAAWWDTDHYTTEDVLWAADMCPIGFLQDVHEEHLDIGIPEQYGQAVFPRDMSSNLYARPVYDIIKGDSLPWFGDGKDRDGRIRNTCALFRFAHRVRGRVQGPLWRGDRPADEIPVDYFELTIDSDTVFSDSIGHYRSGQYMDTAHVEILPHTDALPTNRIWYRLAGKIAGGAGVAAAYWKRSGRLYIAFSGDSGLTVRIHEGDGADYVDRVTGQDNDNGVGIDIYIARGDTIRVVYDSSGSVYSIESASEANTWSEPVSICTGTKPAIAFNPVDGFEILAYINGSNVEVRRNLGNGTFGAAIVVCAADADTSVAVTPITDSRTGTWVLAVRGSDGTVTRYTSTDGGSTWTADV